jgi:hypothetical protein
MTQPDFLNTSICPYSYTQSAGITDVATVITDIRTALVTGLSWTEPSAALFRSPSLGGYWFDMLLTKISATSLEMRVRDSLGRTICTRRVTSDATTTWNYFCGKFYCFIECLRATPEIIQAYMPDPTPDTAGDFRNVVLATALRSNADTSDGLGDAVGDAFQWVDTSALSAGTHWMSPPIDTGNISYTRITGSGALLCEDVQVGMMSPSWSTTVPRYAGRLWQAFYIDSSIAFATDKTLMVDDAASATFRVIGLATLSNTRVALRKSG